MCLPDLFSWTVICCPKLGKSNPKTAVVQINHLSDGMKVGLSDKVEKHSEKLGRDAVFTLKSRITRLPRYLCIQVCTRVLAVGSFFPRGQNMLGVCRHILALEIGVGLFLDCFGR